MNLKNFAEIDEKGFKIIFFLIDLKREIREDIILVMKARTLIENALLKRNRFKNK